MIVTTAGRTNDILREHAVKTAEKYGLTYVERDKQSISSLFKKYDSDVYCVGAFKNMLNIIGTGRVLQFHPNIAQIRAKRILSGKTDRLIELTEIAEGTTILDCTMGLASDSIIMSLMSGIKGNVTAIESDFSVYMMVSEGLNYYDTGVSTVNAAMRRIQTVHGNYKKVLQNLPDNSYDVVYFDPMFSETVKSSDGMMYMTGLVNNEELSEENVREAVRVAKRKVVIKDHFRSPKFDELGFKKDIRPSSSFHFGVINVHEC
ncbi:class I SAM-dependent methyltransferase [Corticicoccus populi]|uniref:Class I SAM-dependent methyltransferase n=1 Tax=Corticicoccus populi TaxID=1812821 RepID=A0ABW5WX12_9STAP